jgi:hypothetical protein
VIPHKYDVVVSVETGRWNNLEVAHIQYLYTCTSCMYVVANPVRLAATHLICHDQLLHEASEVNARCQVKQRLRLRVRRFAYGRNMLLDCRVTCKNE